MAQTSAGPGNDGGGDLVGEGGLAGHHKIAVEHLRGAGQGVVLKRNLWEGGGVLWAAGGKPKRRGSAERSIDNGDIVGGVPANV